MPTLPALSELMELVNGLPGDARDTNQMTHEFRLANPGLNELEVRKGVAARFEAELQRMAAPAREHIGTARGQGGLVSVESQSRYNRLIMARAILRFIALENTSAVQVAQALAEANKGHAQQRDVTRERLVLTWERLPFSEMVLLIGESPTPQWQEPHIAVSWQINKKREVKVTSIPHIQEIEESDCLRIRECPRCSKFFFAGRMHQSACSEPCAHVLRTQRWREAYPEKYKLQRIKQADAREARTKRKRG